MWLFDIIYWYGEQISMLLEQGDIEVCVEGSFNNNINQILPNFNPLPPPRVDKHGHFKYYPAFVT